MIKFEKTVVMNIEGAMRGMRNPMNSWDKCDTYVCYENRADENCAECEIEMTDAVTCAACVADTTHVKGEVVIGPNDLQLARRLRNGGSDDRKFLRQIFVSVDITAPLYWWKEFDTYKVGTVANSTSTMHKIHDREFARGDFSLEHLIGNSECDWGNNGVYADGEWGAYAPLSILDTVILALNLYRWKYLETKNKKWWWAMIQILPSSYNQKRTVTMNYENLVNMYHARKGHKLDEWRIGFCDWVRGLPYAMELIIGDEASK